MMTYELTARYDRLKSFVRHADCITDDQLSTIRATVKREELI